MSDYQTVTVKAVDPANKTVTIEVEENGESRALSSIFDEGPRRGIDDDQERASPEDWRKIGAMLLLDEKAREGEIEEPEDGADPAAFVSKVEKIEATALGEGSSNNPIYRATLRVTVKKASLAKKFEVGESFGAVADPGGDFDELFA
jgi:hypothetical protein